MDIFLLSGQGSSDVGGGLGPVPRLLIQYYHKSILRSIAKVIGTVVRIDYNTEAIKRGKFSQPAVSVDLTKPLISKIMIE